MRFLWCTITVFFLLGCGSDNSQPTPSGIIQLSSIKIGTRDLSFSENNTDIEVDKPIVARFNLPLDIKDINEKVKLLDAQDQEVEFQLSFLDENRTFSLRATEDLRNNSKYTFVIDELTSTDDGQVFEGISVSFTTLTGTLELVAISINNIDLSSSEIVQNVKVDFELTAQFSHPLNPETITNQSVRLLGSEVPEVTISLSESNEVLTLTTSSDLKYLTRHRLILSESITTNDDHEFEGFDKFFYTQLDSTFKFPEITDDELLTKIQEQTFKYFWDFGHPVSGLARERNTSGQTVTSGGSGFGVMAIIVAIERGFITRQEGINRLDKIVTFLGTNADRFHGVWSHWLNGTTGQAIPFSANDDGGDLVETAFMIQGLLTVRQYLNDTDSQEASIIDKINTLWEEVEWDWYTQGDQNVLYWHWSPNFGWEKNHKITGWNEALIIYVLAASSPTHTIDADVYTEGWSRSGAMVNSGGNSFYGHTLDMRSDRGGPLFFSHYSFLGLDPRNLSDQFANYWSQNVNHSLINRDYCAQNPRNYVGYSSASWGLTASDNNNGYSAHSPDNDRGVITPTAAISSLPYTPEESMDAIHHFYYLMGDKLWGEYGFYDAFNVTENWYANSYLAIDQGPIVCMIENHRTGLLWDLFMSAPEVQSGLTKLGFTY